MATTTDRALKQNGKAIIAAAYNWAMIDHSARPGVGGWSVGRGFVTFPDDFGKNSRLLDTNGEEIKGGADFWTKEVFKPINDAVRAAFQPWFGLPNPRGLSAVAEQMRDASYQLCTQAQTKDGVIRGANLEMSILQTIADNVGEFHGTAMIAYKEKYVDKLDGVISAQSAAAALLAAGAEGQKKILEAAHHDVVTIGYDCARAMHARGDDGEPFDLNIVKALTGAVSLVATGGTAKVLAAVASYAVGTFGDFRPTPDPTKVAPSRFNGKDVHQVLEQLKEALVRLKRAIEGREQILDDQLRSVASQLRHYDLNTSGTLLDTTSTERVGVQSPREDPADAFEIKTDLKFLRHVGHDQMPALAKLLVRTERALGDHIGSGTWRRNGRVGMGEVGAHGGWILLNRRLRDLVHETAVEIDRGGDHLVIVAKLLQDTENEVERELLRHKRRVSSHD